MSKRQGQKYIICRGALKGIADRDTVQAYKRNIKRFCSWEKSSSVCHAEDHYTPQERVERYVNYLQQKGYSASTIHTYIAPICKGLEINMKDVSHPKRRSAYITRSRSEKANRQGTREAKQDHFARSVTLQQAVGIRRSELQHLTGSCLRRDESGYLCVEVLRGKGGKHQLQRILPQHEDAVKQMFKGIEASEHVLTVEDMSKHIDYHGMRASVAREAYDYYLSRISTEGKEKLRKELVNRWKKEHKASKTAYDHFCEEVYSDKTYFLRGDNKIRAQNSHRPIKYDRLALMATSVFHLSHWRLDVTVTNYML